MYEMEAEVLDTPGWFYIVLDYHYHCHSDQIEDVQTQHLKSIFTTDADADDDDDDDDDDDGDVG